MNLQQAGFPRCRNLCRQKRHSEPSPAHFVQLADLALQIGDYLPSGSRPSFSLPARENIVVPGAASTRFAMTRPPKSSTCSTVTRASSAPLIFRLSPRPLEAPLTAQLRLAEAEADATCEHQRNPAGEAVLVDRNSERATFGIQFRIPYVMSEWTGSRRE